MGQQLSRVSPTSLPYPTDNNVLVTLKELGGEFEKPILTDQLSTFENKMVKAKIPNDWAC